MKSTRLAIVVLAMIPVLTAADPGACFGSNLRLSLNLYGGLNYLSGSDLNTGLQGLNDFEAKTYWFFGLTRIGGEYKPVHLGASFGGDLIIQFTPALGVGVGAGYLQGSSQSALTFSPVNAVVDTTAKLSAIPLRVSVFYTLPLGSGFEVRLQAGLDYYLAKMSYDLNSHAAGTGTRYQAEADGGGLGFHGGLGLEFDLSPGVSLFFEGQGRYANLGGFDGTFSVTNWLGWHASDTGKLYYFVLNTGVLGAYPVIAALGTMPGGPAVSQAREAKIDFSGFSALAGLLFRF